MVKFVNFDKDNFELYQDYIRRISPFVVASLDFVVIRGGRCTKVILNQVSNKYFLEQLQSILELEGILINNLLIDPAFEKDPSKIHDNIVFINTDAPLNP